MDETPRLHGKGFAPAKTWVWDTWLLEEDELVHAFFLRTPARKDPARRHETNINIGHAVSADMHDWVLLPDALKPVKKGWDDKALWSGSTIKVGDTYYLYYTGRGHKDSDVQRIGLATSEDLLTWKRHPENPLLEADGRIYSAQFARDSLGVIGAFRDPFVCTDENGEFLMVFSAQKGGLFSACLGFARSKDGIHWKLEEPLVAPGEYSEMETPQLVYHDGLWYLLFSTHTHSASPALQERVGIHSGLHGYYAETLRGEWKPINENGVVLNNGEQLYMVRLLRRKKDLYTAVGWLNMDNEHNFIGRICTPFSMTVRDGCITADLTDLYDQAVAQLQPE